MALNIALPLSVGEFMDPLDILSPDHTMGLDSREREHMKMLISPISSESSGVSSMASDEIKKSPEKYTYEDCKVMYGGRNIIDMGSNLTNGSFKIRYTVLPENNYSMFLKNRSQYHRLGAHGHIQEFNLIRCSCCGLMIPDQPELVPISGPNSISRAILAAQVKINGSNNNNNTATNPNPSRIYYGTTNNNNNHMNPTTNINSGGGMANNNNNLRNAFMYRQQHQQQQQTYGQNFNATNNNFKYYGNNCPAIMVQQARAAFPAVFSV